MTYNLADWQTEDGNQGRGHKMQAQVHNFEITTFTKLTKCFYCNKLLWGLANQGLKCSACHKKCVRKDDICNPKSSTETATDPSIKSNEEELCLVDNHFVPELENDDEFMGGKRRSMSESMPSLALSKDSDAKTNGTKSFFADLFKQAVFSSQADSLNLFSTAPRNFVRFVNTIGPFLDLKENITNLFLWKDAKSTWTVYFTASFFCFYPKFLIVAPNFILILFIGKQYYKRLDYKLASSVKKIDLAIEDLKNWEKSRQINYKKNLTGIQNMTGEYADYYVRVTEIMDLFSWKNEETTMLILKLLLVSLVPISIALLLFSSNFLFWICLSVVFFASHPVLQIESERFVPFMNTAIIKIQNLTIPVFLQSLLTARLVKLEENQKKAELYENERWWIGVGWFPPLTVPNFSDEKRTVSTPKESFVLGNLFCWASDWIIEKPAGLVDKDGWQYGDNNWANWKSKPYWNSFCRRRKWTRKIDIKLDDKND